ncbi:Transcriptional regulator STERILE APETALA [Bienertia sinuspersici]
MLTVCTTWRAVSRSELLWQNLVRIVWNSTTLLHTTWRDQFIYLHRTSRNFQVSRYFYTVVRPSDHPLAAMPGGDEGGGAADQLPILCVRLVLAHDHLAVGSQMAPYASSTSPRASTFALFNRFFVIAWASSLRPYRALYFNLNLSWIWSQPGRRAYLGDVVNDGALVDFTGCGRFWVGLYAGVPGRAFRVWDAESEELLFMDGSLTNPESVMGWHMLTEIRPTEFVGRIRIVPHGLAVGATSLRALVLDLDQQGVVVGEETSRRGIIVGSVDAYDETFVMVDTRGVASVRYLRTLEEVCRFSLLATLRSISLRGLIACMNKHGEYLYSLREWVEDPTALATSNQYIVVASSDTTIHIWDFGA